MAANLDIRISATDAASAVFGKVNQSASGLGSSLAGSIGKGVGGLVSGLGAFGLAVEGAKAAIEGLKGVGSLVGIDALSEMEQTRASFMAFTKDAGATEKILADVRAEAAKTPFAFGEMAKATAALLPVSKTSGQGLMDLVKTGEILAASNPMEGLEGASFALKEAMTGDFTSIIERFNLSRQSINQWKSEGVSNFEIVQRAMKEMGLDADLVAAQGETLAGRWSTFQDTLTTLQMTVGQPIFDVLKESLVGLQGALDANMPAIQGFAETLAGGIGQGIEIAKTAIGSLVEVWNSLSEAFSGGGLVGALEALGPMLGSALSNLGSLIASTVEGWATSFAAWVDGAETVQGSKLAEMATGLYAWILDAAVAIVEKLGAWAAAFVDWIAPKIPGMLQQLGAYLSSMAGWLLGTALPLIVSKLAEWGLALVEWVAPRIPPLLAALGDLLLQLGGWVVGTALPAIVEKLLEWGLAFAAWVPGAVARLLVAIGSMELALLGWIGGAVAGIAGELLEWVATFVAWPLIAASQLPGKLVQIGSAIGNWIAGAVGDLASKAAGIGRAIIDGIANAISNGVGAITSAAKRAAQSALDSAKAALGIDSPSKVFELEVGRMIPAGLIRGIEAMQAPLDRSLAGLVQPPALSPAFVGSGAGGTGFGGGGGTDTLVVEFRVDDALAERIVIRGERMRARRVRVDRR